MVRLKYTKAPPTVGQLYRWYGSGRMFVCTAVGGSNVNLQYGNSKRMAARTNVAGTGVTLKSYGMHLHGAITPAKRIHTVYGVTQHGPYNGTYLVAPAGRLWHPHGGTYYQAVTPYTV